MKKVINRVLAIILSICVWLTTFNCYMINAENLVPYTYEEFAELAFPMAEGFGRFATGGRGGFVVEVTNLDDSGAGSLRWALEEVSGPRIIVFKVGGVIELDRKIEIDNEHDEVYIAGQTAPGDGVTIIGSGIKIFDAEDVIIRHLRIRKGTRNNAEPCLEIRSSKNCIIDHCSASWGTFAGISVTDSENITVQNSIVGETLNELYTGIDTPATLYDLVGTAFEITAKNGTFHHNLITNCANLPWYFADADKNSSDDLEYSENLDVRNNIVYNWYNQNQYDEVDDCFLAGKAVNLQFINNYYKKGTDTKDGTLISASGNGYLSGNKMISSDKDVLLEPVNDDQWKLVPKAAFSDGRNSEEIFEAFVNTESADEAYETIIESVGATVPARDYIDSRYIDEVVNGTSTYIAEDEAVSGIINIQSDAEGYPDEATFIGEEAPLDTDHDGMPDEWEEKHGLNPNDYFDACQIYLSDEGYTNIELYINELAGDSVVYSENPTIKYTSNISAPESIPEEFAELAFPTAEGFGRYATGGRGGRVVVVTNLNASGEGSLRWALEDVTEPRIVVFGVGGVISLDNDITINEGNVYVAGQTAPGDGITITGGSLKIYDTENVIVRHLRVRAGDISYSARSLQHIANSHNIIIDHCSFSWSATAGFSTYKGKNFTIQNSIIAESLNQSFSISPTFNRNLIGAATEICAKNATFHQNLITNCAGKIWYFNDESENEYDGFTNNNIDIRNNVVYNWHDELPSDTTQNAQFVNNYYKKGTDIETIYEASVNAETAEDAYETVIADVGANVPKRDYIDNRYIDELVNGKSTYTNTTDNIPGIIRTQDEAEGLPDDTTFKGDEAPADADKDGMPDEWEIKHGLNPYYYYDACQIYLSEDGYTNIEMYINELAGDPVAYSDNPVLRYSPDVPAPDEIVLGDVNRDDDINAVDALAVLKHAAKIEVLSEEDLIRADLNEDEKIDAKDALEILKIAAKITE